MAFGLQNFLRDCNLELVVVAKALQIDKPLLIYMGINLHEGAKIDLWTQFQEL